MKFKIIEPSEKLKDFVKYYWILEQSKPDEEIIPERVVPTGFLQMFFHYKTPFLDEAGQNPQSYFCGQLTKFKDVVAHKNTGMLAVVFYPYAAKAFTHYSIPDLTNKSVDLKEIYGNKSSQLELALKNSNSFESKVNLVEAFLKEHFLISNKYQYGLVKQAVNIIHDSQGKIAVKEVAQNVYIGQRQLERLFKSMVGITPKMYSQIIRFYYALQSMSSIDNISDVCYKYNYFDQAHFIKEFKRFTGMTPKQYFSHESNELEEFD